MGMVMVGIRAEQKKSESLKSIFSQLRDLPLSKLEQLAADSAAIGKLLGGGESDHQTPAQKSLPPAKAESAPGEDDLLRLLGPAAQDFKRRAESLLQNQGLPDLPANRIAALWHVLRLWGQQVREMRDEEATLAESLTYLHNEEAAMRRFLARLREEVHAAQRELSETRQATKLAMQMAVEEAAKIYQKTIEQKQAEVKMLEAAINGLENRRRNPGAWLAAQQEPSPLALAEAALKRQIMVRTISSIV